MNRLKPTDKKFKYNFGCCVSILIVFLIFYMTTPSVFANVHSNSTITNSNSTITNSNSTINDQNGTITSFPGMLDSDRRHMPAL